LKLIFLCFNESCNYLVRNFSVFASIFDRVLERERVKRENCEGFRWGERGRVG
jgi:hypothetical protein